MGPLLLLTGTILAVGVIYGWAQLRKQQALPHAITLTVGSIALALYLMANDA
ncbi:hypothetical protein [Natronoglycomyces albus]|uniref:Uncharacterized protein n=1 Tax=Natronoglycomyces albus TaxID=2811108 RepID=A0A895XU00_9ACTN|nr:hypothetical protein [Natronoglycomyces albus]QSB05996.1 hypothetical protein JQS30_03470 [Natronoglycomyces albus]